MRPGHVLLAVLVAAVWGFNFVVIHVGISQFPPLLFSALRFTVASIPLVFFVRKPDISWRILLSIGLVLGVVKFSLLFVGMDKGVSAGLASLVLQSQAFFTAVLAWLVFKDKPRPIQVLGILLAFGGIGLIASTVDQSITPIGLSLVLAAGFAWAVSNLLMKLAGQVDMLSLIVWVSLIPPLPLLILSMFLEGPGAAAKAFSNLNGLGIGAIAYIAFAATILGFGLWGKLIRHYGASRVAPFSLLVPVFGMSFSALLLGENFGPVRLIAAILIIGGLILTVVRLPKTFAAANSRV